MAYKPQSRPGMTLDPSGPINRGLVGFWPLNEGGGSGVNDVSQKTGRGVSVLDPLWIGGSAGVSSGGLLFNGTTQYTPLPNIPVLAFPLASSYWVKPTAAAAGIHFVMYGSSTVFIANGLFTSGTNFYTSSTTFYGAPGSAFNIGRWNHVVTNQLSLAGATTVWVNKKKYVNSVTTGGYGNGTSSALARRVGGASDRYFDGALANIRIYNRLLKDEEVELLYDSPFTGLYTPTTAKYFVAAGGGVTVTATAQGLTLTGQAPAISGTGSVQPTVQALTLAQQAPAVSGAAVVQPTAQALSLALQAPAVTTDGSVIVSVSAQTLSVAQQTPTETGTGVVSVTAQSLLLARPDPSVSLGVTVTPSVMALISAAYGPVMLGDGAVTPGNLHLALGLNEPSIPDIGITIYPTYLSLTVSLVTGLTVETTDAWLRRQNIDSGGWSNRRVTSATTVIGSGNSGFFIIGSIDGSMFWRPRHLRYGEIYAGPDLWTNRTTGTAMWVRR